METFSIIKSPSTLNPWEGDNAWFIKRYNSLLTNDDTKAVNDLYLLLMVYVNYFCITVLAIIPKNYCESGKSFHVRFSIRLNFVYMAIGFLVEAKECISKILFSLKEQVEINFYKETYIEKPCCYS